MRAVAVGLVTVMAGTLMAGVAAADPPQQRGRGPAVPGCTTLACDVQGDWERTRMLLLDLVNAMPDDKWSFKPTPAQQTFAERAMHAADVDIKLFSTLGAKTPPPAVDVKGTTKADAVAALQASFDYGSAVLKELTDQQLGERVASMPFFGPSASRLKVIYFSMQHSNDIYGQLVVYLRLNGITPPASNRGA
jgi:uncharacterized damage-inducible protein DinB